MNYHIILTRQCNLNCIYCHGGEQTEDTEIQYSIDELAAFLEKDRTSAILMFYGGEPLLRIPLLLQLMDRFPHVRFMLQTNGLLLDEIPPDYVHRFHSILVSIDGTEETTDRYRSKGVYKKVVENVRWLRAIGYHGDIVARMAVSQETDIYRDVRHLIEMNNPSFDHVHWQLNAFWDAEGNWTDFDGWVEDSYKPGIEKLAGLWLRELQKGKIEGIVPFIPLVYTLLTGENTTLRCGSGIDTFAIHVDGSIGICPISPDWEFSIIGNIENSTPSDLANAMSVEEPCPSCDIYGICGGRCLFANKQRLWGEEGFEKVCATVKHLVSILRRILPEIEQLIENRVLEVSDFQYPEFNNGCEIIP